MRVTVQQLRDWKRQGQRFAVLTCYEYSIAKLLDAAGIPVLLVGDSMGSVVLGFENTLPVKIEDMIRHAAAVVRGAKQALVVADMPFMTFQTSAEDAMRAAARLLQETGAQAVKLEGGTTVAPTVRRLVDAGIPVMGHIGLTPQSVHQMGYKVQGKTVQVATRLLADAAALEDAGVFSIVLEGVPAPLAGRITQSVSVPTIGIGAGPLCDAQVQVIHDILGLFTDFIPKHARRYADLGQIIQEAARQYAADVTGGEFPGAKESFTMDERVLHELDAGEPRLEVPEHAPAREPEFGGYAPKPS
ncbi:MAG TPA: 3-methyl-2-oxobutanoate hydroxymethyltransferase [Chloroflexota bacterium]|nr:3-methyl-2-oxobutanoate hydroxymethyltransferase [Chloroflexota bacterium]